MKILITISWMDGYREDLFSLISMSARRSKHVDFTLPIVCLHGFRTALRSLTKPLAKLPDTKLPFPGIRLLMWSCHWCVINFKRLGFRVNPSHPTRRLPTQDHCLAQRIQIAVRITTTTDFQTHPGKYNYFQSMISCWCPEPVTSLVAFVIF